MFWRDYVHARPGLFNSLQESPPPSVPLRIIPRQNNLVALTHRANQRLTVEWCASGGLQSFPGPLLPPPGARFLNMSLGLPPGLKYELPRIMSLVAGRRRQNQARHEPSGGDLNELDWTRRNGSLCWHGSDSVSVS